MTKGQEEMVKGILDEFLKQMNSSFKMEFTGFNKAVDGAYPGSRRATRFIRNSSISSWPQNLTPPSSRSRRTMHQQIQRWFSLRAST